MANADTSDCEERPSRFLCKTSSGHLCETCRNEHGMKKLTREKSVCAECIRLYLKGHAKKSLTTDLKWLKDFSMEIRYKDD